MASYKPNVPFSTAMVLLVPTYSTSYGVPTKTYPAISNGIRFNGSFKTYGGTEREVNGLYSIENTAIIETWYNPSITAECRIVVMATNQVYEIMGEPENIELRNQYMKFKVQQVKGGA